MLRTTQRDELVTQNAEPVTQAASDPAFCVTDANHLLVVIWYEW